MANREKKGKTEIQKFEYLENEKSFLDETKAFFIITWGLSFGEEIKNSRQKRIKKLYGSFLLMGFNFLMATEALHGSSLLFSSKLPEILGKLIKASGKVLKSWSWGPMFKFTGWLQGQLRHSSIQGW